MLFILLISSLIGILSGIASAIFLISLDWVTAFRESNHWIILFLPIAGYFISLWYEKNDKRIARGNHYLIEEALQPKNKIPLIMLPMILISTLITHLFGGSAGREGTALQMGGTIGDNIAEKLKLTERRRRLLILMGMSSGFGSLFGTPFAAAIFATEVILLQRKNIWMILPCLFTSIIANETCKLLQAKHSIYTQVNIDIFNIKYLSFSIIAGCLFGLVATSFTYLTRFLEHLFARTIKHTLLKPIIGGTIIVFLAYTFSLWDYLGLGIPTIQNAIIEQQDWYSFVIKLGLTSLTLSCGFKGGEVTPLFFIGATLGNACALFLPVPIELLAPIGFVAVFAGATNTPIACAIMGIELFGYQIGIYAFLACYIAYFISSHQGIYHTQPKSPYKLWAFL